MSPFDQFLMAACVRRAPQLVECTTMQQVRERVTPAWITNVMLEEVLSLLLSQPGAAAASVRSEDAQRQGGEGSSVRERTDGDKIDRVLKEAWDKPP